MVARSAHLLSQLEDIQRTEDAHCLTDAFERGVADYGGCAFAVGVIGPGVPVVQQQRGLGPWIDYFHESGLYRNCVFTRRTSSSFIPFTWDEEIAVSGDLTHAVVSAAAAYGLKHGLHVPVMTREGSRGGVFIQSEAAELDPDRRLALVALSFAVHSKLEQIVNQRELAQVSLSPREREVLTWFARGKSSDDVAAIIGIATATVMFHYRNVASRYGTLNRTHTVVEAIRRGAIDLN